MIGEFIVLLCLWKEAESSPFECTSYCPTDWVRCTQRGDGYCDSICNVQACGFDRSDEGDDDCFYDCQNTGCLNDDIGNGKCDSGCNSYQCGFDGGDCGYCGGKGCTQELLENGVCDEVCSMEECGQDNGDCYECSEGCFFYSMVGDNKCDPKCDNEACDFDMGDCGRCNEGCTLDLLGNGKCDDACITYYCRYDDEDCSEEFIGYCYIPFIGNGECDSDCNTAAANWDEDDCNCAPGCTHAMQYDDNCDIECAVSSDCHLDNHFCVSVTQGDCAFGCYNSMIGDGICQDECYSAACEYDHGDCYCAAACSPELKGQCSPACMVPACSFDNYAQKGGCRDQLILDLTYFYQMTLYDSNALYDSKKCFDVCNKDSFETAYKTHGCLEASCMIDACVKGLGGCQVSRDSGGCKVRAEAAGECIECYDGEYLFGSVCSKNPPRGYTPFPAKPQFLVPKQDKTSPSAPDVFYVTYTTESEYLGNGSFETPYENLVIGLAGVSFKYTIINLLGKTIPTEYDLSSKSPELRSIASGLQPLANKEFESLVIQSLTCEVTSHPKCSPDPTTIDVTSLLQFVYSGSLVVQNVDFTAVGAFLKAAPLVYCPLLAENVNGVLVNERGNKASQAEKIAVEVCEKFHLFSFFVVGASSNLTLIVSSMQSVNFTNFRNEMASVIDITGGSVFLDRVKFVNVTADGSSQYHSVVTQNRTCAVDFCGNFEYRNGEVKLISNGYEYSEEGQLTGFLSAPSLSSVLIVNVNFTYNMATDTGTIASASGYSLLYFENFITLSIENCVFFSNIVTGGLVTVKSAVDLPKALNERSEAIAYALRHFALISSNFTSNFAAQSLIHLVFTKDLQNMLISGCIFDGNAVEAGSIIHIESTDSVSTAIVSGARKNVKLPPPKKKASVWIAPRYISILFTTFLNQASYSSLITIAKCANIELANLRFSNNGDSRKDGIASVFGLYMKLADTYARKQPATSYANCLSSATFQAATNVAIRNVTATGGSCTKGGVGFWYSQTSGNNSVENFAVSKSKGAGQGGLALFVSEELTITLTNLTMTGNRMDGSSVLYFQSYSIVNLSASAFSSNTGERGACIRAEAGLLLRLWNSTFTANSSPENIGGVLALALQGSKPTKTTITDCAFELNSATVGGALVFSTLAILEIEMILQRNQFSYNTATQKAGVLSVEQLLKLSLTSIVDNCTFQYNESPYGAISTMHYSGTFRLNNLRLIGNAGEVASGIHIESGPGASNLLTNLVFETHRNGPVIMKTNSRVMSHIESKNCTYRKNAAGVASLEGGEWRDDSSQYLESTTRALTFTLGSAVYMTNALFIENSSNGTGGAVYLGSRSSLTCSSCEFVRNKAALGGALYSEQDSTLSLSYCRIEGNTAASTGSALLLITSQGTVSTFSHCNFTKNAAGESSLIVAQNAVFVLEFVEISENTARDNPGIMLLLSSASLKNCTLHDQTASSAPFLYIVTESSVEMRGTSVYSGSGEYSGAVFVVSSNFAAYESMFTGITGVQMGVIFASSVSTLTLNGVTITDVSSSQPGSIVSAADSSLQVANSHFQRFRLDGIVGENLYQLSISSSTFTDGSGTNGAAVSCSMCVSVQLSDTRFTSTSGVLGGAVYIETTEGAKESTLLSIVKCEFTANSAQKGGAVYISNAVATIDQCSFTGNKALGSNGEGGSMMLDCTVTDFCKFTITNTGFTRNSAKMKGGAISWNLVKPAVTSCTMTDNRAEYGADLASFPIRLQLHAITFTAGRVLQANNSTEVSNIAPGQPAGLNLTASLLDHYERVVNIDSTSPAELAAGDDSASVSGKSKVTAINGMFVFDDFRVFAAPGSTAKVRIETIAITASQAGDPDLHSPVLPLIFHMRECQPGETQTPSSCVICDKGTYGFDPSQPCDKCPANAQCLGNITIYPDSGYWRSGLYSSVVWECPNPKACLGGEYNNTYNLTGGCATGFTGNMCQSCQINYSRTGKNKCGLCPDRTANAVQLALIGAAAVVLNIILISSTLKNATKPTALHSIYLKILMNYLQLVLLVTDFKLQWPDPVLKLFDAQEQAGGVTQQAYSFDCFLAGSHPSSDVYFQKIIAMAVLPAALLIICTLVWGGLAVWKRKALLLKRELSATCVIVFFMIHPNLVLTLFSMFSCTEINPGELWLTIDLSIRCWDSKHFFYTLAVGLPAIVVWVFAVPFLCLGVLAKNRRQQDELWVRMQYGFLINGYQRRRYYWEFVIMYRKIAIICCAVFLNSSIGVQALTVQLVILAFLFLQYNTLPYTSETLNSLELKAIVVADLTIYCGLYYLTDDLSLVSSWFFIILILCSNAVFISYWVYLMLEYAKIHILKQVPAIARIVAPELLDLDPYIEEFLENSALKAKESAIGLVNIKLLGVYTRMLTVSPKLWYDTLNISKPLPYVPSFPPLPRSDVSEKNSTSRRGSAIETEFVTTFAL